MVHQDNSQPDQQKRPAPAIQHPDVQEQPDQPSPQPDQSDQHLTSSNPQKRPNPQKQPNEEPENPVRQQK